MAWLQQNDEKVHLSNFSPEQMNRCGSEGTLRIKSTTDYTPCSLQHIDTSLGDLLKEFYYKEIHPLMSNGGGIITFELKGGLASGVKFLDALQMLSVTNNLGDSRSIASHPASTTHSK